MRRALRVVPAIDLRAGYAVRLERGELSRETRYDADPVARAKTFVGSGAQSLHVVDLDGAFGTGGNGAALRAICAAVDVPVQTGGGVRSAADVAARLAAGAAAVIIGTLLVERPADARALVETYGDRVVAGIDARGDRVARRGWVEHGATSRDDLVRAAAESGFARIVFTEIARDGMGSGYDVAALAHVASLAPVRITASGGARTLDDLLALRDGTPENVDAAIVGRALYEGTLDLGAALQLLAR